MQENFEELKQAYLRQIEPEYSPSKKRSWWSTRPKYFTTTGYAAKLKKPISAGSEIVLMNQFIAPWIILLLILPGIFLFQFVQAKWVLAMGMIVLFIIIIIIANWLTRKPGRKKMITMDKTGVSFHTKNAYMRWSNVLRTDIKEDIGGDSNDEYLVVHGYDEQQQQFRAVEIDISDLTVRPAELAFLVEHFKKNGG